MKRALVTGITGQDGSYLAELLLNQGYEVWGMYRRSSTDSHFERIEHLGGRLNLICGDMGDFCSLEKVITQVKPDEVYNLAAQSHVGVSETQEHETKEINWLGVERLLDILTTGFPDSRFYQASTSEMFGNSPPPQDEKTHLDPQSPYAKAKVKAYRAVERERLGGLFGCNGILFNHESPRRGLDFVTRKFTDGLARIKLGLPQRGTERDTLEIGNLKARRDWGFAGDYVKAMWMMMQQETPDDYVIATGEHHTVREFLEATAAELGIEIYWEGEGVEEVGYDRNNKKIIEVNPKYFRLHEVKNLLGDSSKAGLVLGWKPEVTFPKLVEMMVKADYDKLEKLN
jgi:GDPmannose 4,6-dehydratase